MHELLHRLGGPLIVLLNNSSTQEGGRIEQLQRQHRRLQIEYFRSYVPELNPDEGVRAQAKRELADSCPRDVNEKMEDILRSNRPYSFFAAETSRLHPAVRPAFIFALARQILYAESNKHIFPKSFDRVEVQSEEPL